MKKAFALQIRAHILSVLLLLGTTAAFGQSNPRELFEQARMLDERSAGSEAGSEDEEILR